MVAGSNPVAPTTNANNHNQIERRPGNGKRGVLKMYRICKGNPGKTASSYGLMKSVVPVVNRETIESAVTAIVITARILTKA